MWVLGGVDVITSRSSALDNMGCIGKFRSTYCYNYLYRNFNIRRCSSECGTCSAPRSACSNLFLHMCFNTLIGFQFTCHIELSCPEPMHSFNYTYNDLKTDHRVCPLPQYIIVSCCLGYFTVAIFLRLPIIIKCILLVFMSVIYVLFIEFSHYQLFVCYDHTVS